MADINIKFPTMDEFAKEVAEKALDEFLYDGKSIREWIQIIASEDCISRQAVDELSKELVHTTKDKADFLCNLWERLQKLPPVRPQEPFDIDTYCKEHFCVMVDKDVWEKAEKALKQDPILDKIRSEIEELKPHSHYTQEMKNKVLEIIDKYRGES